ENGTEHSLFGLYILWRDHFGRQSQRRKGSLLHVKSRCKTGKVNELYNVAGTLKESTYKTINAFSVKQKRH
ncbi:MAG: hypothetical protein CSB34_00130, partial [Desulfobulbus propionicus]